MAQASMVLARPLPAPGRSAFSSGDSCPLTELSLSRTGRILDFSTSAMHVLFRQAARSRRSLTRARVHSHEPSGTRMVKVGRSSKAGADDGWWAGAGVDSDNISGTLMQRCFCKGYSMYTGPSDWRMESRRSTWQLGPNTSSSHSSPASGLLSRCGPSFALEVDIRNSLGWTTITHLRRGLVLVYIRRGLPDRSSSSDSTPWSAAFSLRAPMSIPESTLFISSASSEVSPCTAAQ
mmetsp:Transcript_1812/g.3563  ORF Transcript_1812/g.3563 Transcript_1812/m.3563 type:complete len:235 (+) Transcript_1812:688-1392(+)